MSFFENTFQIPKIDKMKAIFNMDNVSEKTQEHIKDVYKTLCICTSLFALAAYMNASVILVQGFIS